MKRCCANCRTPPAASTRRSAATAISSPIWCGGLLENGANSSFVSVAADPSVPIEEILRRPQSAIANPRDARNKKIPLPRDLYRPERQNSAGIEFGDARQASRRCSPRSAPARRNRPKPRRWSTALRLSASNARSPRRSTAAPSAWCARATRRSCARRWRRRKRAFRPGRRRPAKSARHALERAADLLESHRGELLALLQNEGGKTLDDALAEVARGGRLLPLLRRAGAHESRLAQPLPGPTGESNVLRYRGRGVFVCISPWNFPLAIFLGQVARRARRRQCGRGEARRADAARCRARRSAAASGRRAGDRAASGARRRQGRRKRSSPMRAPPASASPARPRSGARSIRRSPPRTDRSCR